MTIRERAISLIKKYGQMNALSVATMLESCTLGKPIEGNSPTHFDSEYWELVIKEIELIIKNK